MKLGIANDSVMALRCLKKVVEASHEVLWMAENGVEAVDACKRDTPELVLMDLMMPKMDGIEATRQIMASCPCPILVVTASVLGHAPEVYQALGAGALDAVRTPTLGFDGDGGNSLLNKIATIESLVRPRSGFEKAALRARSQLRRTPLIAIGASAGGPGALEELLRALPLDVPPIVVVQHIDSSFAKGLVEWLDGRVEFKVKEAKAGEEPVSGEVHLPVGEEHLVLGSDGKYHYTPEPTEVTFRPSIDVFFDSVAENWSGPVAGLLLTGLGVDGARGLLQLKEAGHYTVAQSEDSSLVFGMPKAAIQMGAATEVLSLKASALELARRFRA